MSDITFTATKSWSSLIEVASGILDFGCLDTYIPDPDSMFVQVPIAGTALVPIYHISSLNESLILDGETLALIFMGNISTWNHPAIQDLNPKVTLPHANITIAVTPGLVLGTTEVLKKALSLFNGDFGRELANAGNDLSKMRPAVEGRAFTAPEESDRLQFVQVGFFKD